MSLIVSPNLAIDRTVSLERLAPGTVMRPRRAVTTAGCKGLNVGRALSVLGHTATLVSFLPRADADVASRLLEREPVRFSGIDVDGELRVATIYLEDDGRVTVLNEPGPDVSQTPWHDLTTLVDHGLAAGEHTTVVCSGSLPPGSPDDGYARLVHIARRHGVPVVVDAARHVLGAALEAAPDVVTPNLAEAEGALGEAANEPVDDADEQVAERAVAAVRGLCERGARTAVVTAGAAGAAFGSDHEVRWIPGVAVSVTNPIGAGDAFVGGLVQALESGAGVRTGILRGLATASASCEHERAGVFDPASADHLYRAYEARAKTALVR